MRVYLPATVAMLRRAVAEDGLVPVGGTGFAVTAGLRAEYEGADEEELEYLAMHDAALASLRLIGGSGGGPAVRVVLAVDDESAVERGDLDRAAVRLAGRVPWSAVVSVHLDGGDAEASVRAAADAIDAADLGDPDAAVVVGDAEDIDLAWYAPDEIGYLLAELGPE
jgi:hypothetical protein